MQKDINCSEFLNSQLKEEIKIKDFKTKDLEETLKKSNLSMKPTMVHKIKTFKETFSPK